MAASTKQTLPAAQPPSPVRTLADVLDVARRLPGGIVDADGHLVEWPEVTDRADRLASALYRRGARRADRVAVLLPKSVESFVTMHGVLRAGLVAVPLNPLSTRRALAPTVAISEPDIVITTADLADRLLDCNDLARDDVMVVLVGDVDVDVASDSGPISWAAMLEEDPIDFAESSRPEPDDDAYILFTSGSTGTPKGMVHTHCSALTYVRSAMSFHELDDRSRLAGTAPLHFDMSTLELYAAPLAGATTLTITEADERFPATLSQRLDERRATHLYAVPSLLHQLLERGVLDDRDLSAIRHVAFAGEPMGAALLGSWMDRVPDAVFLNAYGPAEVNVVTAHRFDRTRPLDAVPIGRAWPGVATRVVDESGLDVAAGQVGELLVATLACMRGYWRLDDETAARVSIDEHGVRWYRTGDLVRSDDGVFHFAGRRDNQVKVRGVRIELEAVELVICAEPSVAQALVGLAVGADGTAALHAWVVARPGCAVDTRGVQRWCRARLTGPALPTSMTVVETLPVTSNGKLDRAAVAEWVAGTSPS